jgi:hypothetical protein
MKACQWSVDAVLNALDLLIGRLSGLGRIENNSISVACIGVPNVQLCSKLRRGNYKAACGSQGRDVGSCNTRISSRDSESS